MLDRVLLGAALSKCPAADVGKSLGMDVDVVSVLVAVASSPIVFGCVSNAVVEIAVDETVGNVI